MAQTVVRTLIVWSFNGSNCCQNSDHFTFQWLKLLSELWSFEVSMAQTVVRALILWSFNGSNCCQNSDPLKFQWLQLLSELTDHLKFLCLKLLSELWSFEVSMAQTVVRTRIISSQRGLTVHAIQTYHPNTVRFSWYPSPQTYNLFTPNVSPTYSMICKSKYNIIVY